MNHRLRSWSEILADESERCDSLAPLGQDRPPCVLMLPYGFRADPELLVQEILGYLDPDRPYVEPTQEEIDAWMIEMMDDRGEG